jgi:hypothetical protein
MSKKMVKYPKQVTKATERLKRAWVDAEKAHAKAQNEAKLDWKKTKASIGKNGMTPLELPIPTQPTDEVLSAQKQLGSVTRRYLQATRRQHRKHTQSRDGNFTKKWDFKSKVSRKSVKERLDWSSSSGESELDNDDDNGNDTTTHSDDNDSDTDNDSDNDEDGNMEIVTDDEIAIDHDDNDNNSDTGNEDHQSEIDDQPDTIDDNDDDVP